MTARTRRGADTQALVANYLRDHGFPFAESTGAGRNGADITGTPSIAVEVKARANFDPASALRQADANADGRLPFVVTRLNGQGPAVIEEWPVVIRFGAFVRLLNDAGHGAAPLDKEAP